MVFEGRIRHKVDKVVCVNIYSMFNKNSVTTIFCLFLCLTYLMKDLSGHKKAVHGGLSVQRKYLDMRQSR